MEKGIKSLKIQFCHVLKIFVNLSETNDANEKFRIITLIQDVGSGKTHLTLNIRISGIKEKAIISYLDMSQIYPKNIPSIYQAMISGFEPEYLVYFEKRITLLSKRSN